MSFGCSTNGLALESAINHFLARCILTVGDLSNTVAACLSLAVAASSSSVNVQISSMMLPYFPSVTPTQDIYLFSLTLANVAATISGNTTVASA